MSLSFGISPLFLIPCLIVAALLAFWVYHNTVPRVSRPKQVLLTILRFGSLFLVLFLLFEPILQNLIRSERRPVLAVLVDDSQSLTLHGSAQQDSLSKAPLMSQAIDAFDGSTIPGDIQYFKFSANTIPIPEASPAVSDSFLFGGERTNMSQALDYVRDYLKDENLQGVLLLSDGQFNTGRNPAFQAERYPIPIHTVVIGDTTQKRDVQIRRVTTNEIAYIEDVLPIQAGIVSEDFGGERVTVSLFEGSTLLQSKNVTLQPGTTEIPVDLEHTPTTPGLQRYSITVSQLPGEATTRNNTQSFVVRVLENRKRILLLAASPEPDVASFQQLLAFDKNLNIDSYVQKSPSEFYNPAPLDSLELYDAVILLGYPGDAASPQIARQVAGAIDEGLPALFVLSRQTNLQLFRDIFGSILPVTPRALRTNLIESSFTPTAEGLQHPLFQISDLDPSYWTILPPLIFNDSRWLASPDARVLATHKVRGIQLDDPLLVVQNRNKHRTAALLGAGTWRWKNLPEDLEEAGPVWTSLFSNTIQWVTTKEDDRPVRVSPLEDLFSGESSIQFSGQVYDESLNPVDGASLEVTVVASDRIEYPYTMKPVGNGNYILDAGVLPEGTYRYRSRATKNGIDLGEDEGTFAVGSLTVEFNETQADGGLMRSVAQRSGGIFLNVNSVSELSTHLQQSESFRSVFFEERIETELWQKYLFLIVIIVLLTTEWFIRKRSGMV